MLPAILLAASFLTAAPSRAATASAVSPSIEERLDALLSDMLGPGRARAFVRLVPRPLTFEELPPEPEAKPAALWDRMNARLADAPPVLPGFPTPRNLREEVMRELVAQATPERVPEREQTLSVTLLVDQTLGDAELAAATDAVARALALNAAHGDALHAARTRLAPRWKRTLQEPAVLGGAAAGGTAGAALLTGLALVALALRGRRGQDRPVFITPPAAPAAPRPEYFPVQPAIHPPVLPVTDPILPPLGPEAAAICAELLRDGPGAVTTWLLSRAASQEAAQVYARLPGPIRQESARRLADAFEPYPEPPSDPADLAARLGRRVAGLERLEDIVLRLGEPFRSEATMTLRLCAPNAAARLSALPFFPDLADADPEDLRLCLSPYSSALLAAALSPEPPEVRCAFLDSLPGVAAGLIRGHLSAEPRGGRREQGDILSRWIRLQHAGRVRRLSSVAR